MAVILQVNFTPSAAQAARSAADGEARARELANLPGLIWKVWLRNADENKRGGVYLFADLASAKAWGDDILAHDLAKAGATDISVRYFDVNEAASLITHASLQRDAAAAAA